MGPFCATRSNPTHQLTDPIQVENIGPDPTQPDTTNKGDYSLVVTYFYTQNLSRTFSQPSINLFMFFTDHYLTTSCNQMLSNRALNAST